MYGFGNDCEIAKMHLDNADWGYLQLSRQQAIHVDDVKWWDRRRSFDRLVEKYPDLVFLMVDFQAVSFDDVGDQIPSVAGTFELTDEKMTSLEHNEFLLTGLTFELRWLQGDERLGVLNEVFGIDFG